MYEDESLQAPDISIFHLKLMLSAVIYVPESAIIICRENTAELRESLRHRRILVNAQYQMFSLLDLAVGWPEGLEILLEFGADVRQGFFPLLYPGTEYHSSARILLREGCIFSMCLLDESLTLPDPDKGERMLLLVDELAARRKRL